MAMLLMAGCASLPMNPADMTAEQIKAAVADKSYSMGCAVTETPYKINTIFLNLDKGVIPNQAAGRVIIGRDCSVTWEVAPVGRPGMPTGY